MPDIREALNEAYDQVESAENEEETGGPGEEGSEESVGAATSEEQAGGEQEGTDEEGKEIEAKENDDGGSEEEKSSGEEGKAEEEEEPEPTSSSKAPAGWSAKAREQWSKIPADVQAEITRRESSFSRGIQKYAEESKFGNAIRQVVDPYKQIIAMEGVDEVTAVGNLMKQGAVMRLGNPQQKAEMVRDIIQNYQVDIEMLDNLLVGQQPLSPEAQQFSSMLDSRLGPLEQFMKNLETHNQQSSQQQVETVNSEIYEFENDPANEFIEDLRDDMADVLELAAKRGQKMTLKQAYDKAAQLNPEISEILQGRETARLAAESRKNIEKKKAASASVSGGVGGGNNQPAPKDRRDALSQAWDAHS